MAVRPIDAIELQRRMCALCNQDYSDEPCEPSDCVFIRAINEMPTLTPPNEWVSVEDAMPPELKMVLVYCGGLYDVAGWVKNEEGEVCWTCKTAPDFWRQIPEME